MLGDANVGKTSFVMRYVYGYVSDPVTTEAPPDNAVVGVAETTNVVAFVRLVIVGSSVIFGMFNIPLKVLRFRLLVQYCFL